MQAHAQERCSCSAFNDTVPVLKLLCNYSPEKSRFPAEMTGPPYTLLFMLVCGHFAMITSLPKILWKEKEY